MKKDLFFSLRHLLESSKIGMSVRAGVEVERGKGGNIYFISLLPPRSG